MNNDSSIRSNQGTDFILRELYMETFPSRYYDVFGTTNIENFVKIEMEEGGDNETSDHGVKNKLMVKRKQIKNNLRTLNQMMTKKS